MVRVKDVEELLYWIDDNLILTGKYQATMMKKTCYRLIYNINQIRRNISVGLDMSKSIERVTVEYKRLLDKRNKFIGEENE